MDSVLVPDPNNPKRNTVIRDSHAILKEVTKYWMALFKAIPKTNKNKGEWWKHIPRKEKYAGADRLSDPITVEEVKATIEKAKNNTALGMDGIPYEVLKAAPLEYLEWLTKVMNICLTKKEIPETWKNSLLYMLHKASDDTKDFANYQSIALLSVEYKVYSSILMERLKSHMEVNNLLSPTQGGFRPGMSCYMHLATITEIINERNQSKNNAPLHLLYIDLKKAFDTLPHWVLEEALTKYGSPQNSPKS